MLLARQSLAAAIATALILAPGAATAVQPDIRPGLWEFTMIGMAGMKQQVCLTPAMVKDMKQIAAKGDVSSDCKLSNEKVSGATRSFDISCTRPARYDGKVAITVAGPDSFSMSQDYVVDHGGQKMAGKMAMTYRRVGDCRKP